MTRLRWALGGALLLLIASSASAAGTSALQDDIFIVRIDATTKAPPSTAPLVERSVPPGLVGRHCRVAALVGNNESMHRNNDLIVTSGGASVRIPDVESVPGRVVQAGGTLALGDTVSVAVEIGEDGVFSGGDMAVAFNCAPPPPPPDPEPTIGVTISADPEIDAPGATATFTVEITNDSPDSEPVTLTLFTYNGHPVIDEESEVIENSDCALVEVEAGSGYTCSFEVEVLGSAGDEDRHTIFVSARGRSGRPAQATAEHLLTIVPPPAPVLVALMDDELDHEPLVCGDEFTYTAAFVNLGSEDVQVTVNLDLPPELSAVGSTEADATIPPGGAEMWTVDVAVARDVAKPVIARLVLDGEDLIVRGALSEPTVIEGEGTNADCETAAPEPGSDG